MASTQAQWAESVLSKCKTELEAVYCLASYCSTLETRSEYLGLALDRAKADQIEADEDFVLVEKSVLDSIVGNHRIALILISGMCDKRDSLEESDWESLKRFAETAHEVNRLATSST